MKDFRMICGKEQSDEFRKHAVTFRDGIEALDKEGPWDILYLDHDLGPIGDGTDIMNWLSRNKHKMPLEIKFVTANPDGLKRMKNILENIEKNK
jgi:hypothetical protein